jgi:hypothetical protein
MIFTIDLGAGVGHNSHGLLFHLRTSIIRPIEVHVNFSVVQTHAHDSAILMLIIEFVLLFSHVN